MVDLPAEMDQSTSGSSDCLNLTLLVVLAGRRSQSKLFLDGHGRDNLLSHAASRQVVIPIVAVHQHHDHVHAHQENN